MAAVVLVLRLDVSMSRSGLTVAAQIDGRGVDVKRDEETNGETVLDYDAALYGPCTTFLLYDPEAAQSRLELWLINFKLLAERHTWTKTTP